jgi:transposase
MSHLTVFTGPERRRRHWSEADQCRIVAASLAPGATVAAVARQNDIATSMIYKWRRALRDREAGFAEVVVAEVGPVVASAPGSPMFSRVLPLIPHSRSMSYCPGTGAA